MAPYANKSKVGTSPRQPSVEQSSKPAAGYGGSPLDKAPWFAAVLRALRKESAYCRFVATATCINGKGDKIVTYGSAHALQHSTGGIPDGTFSDPCMIGRAGSTVPPPESPGGVVIAPTITTPTAETVVPTSVHGTTATAWATLLGEYASEYMQAPHMLEDLDRDMQEFMLDTVTNDVIAAAYRVKCGNSGRRLLLLIPRELADTSDGIDVGGATVAEMKALLKAGISCPTVESFLALTDPYELSNEILLGTHRYVPEDTRYANFRDAIRDMGAQVETDYKAMMQELRVKAMVDKTIDSIPKLQMLKDAACAVFGQYEADKRTRAFNEGRALTAFGRPPPDTPPDDQPPPSDQPKPPWNPARDKTCRHQEKVGCDGKHYHTKCKLNNARKAKDQLAREAEDKKTKTDPKKGASKKVAGSNHSSADDDESLSTAIFDAAAGEIEVDLNLAFNDQAEALAVTTRGRAAMVRLQHHSEAFSQSGSESSEMPDLAEEHSDMSDDSDAAAQMV